MYPNEEKKQIVGISTRYKSLILQLKDLYSHERMKEESGKVLIKGEEEAHKGEMSHLSDTGL